MVLRPDEGKKWLHFTSILLLSQACLCPCCFLCHECLSSSPTSGALIHSSKHGGSLSSWMLPSNCLTGGAGPPHPLSICSFSMVPKDRDLGGSAPFSGMCCLRPRPGQTWGQTQCPLHFASPILSTASGKHRQPLKTKKKTSLITLVPMLAGAEMTQPLVPLLPSSDQCHALHVLWDREIQENYLRFGGFPTNLPQAKNPWSSSELSEAMAV